MAEKWENVVSGNELLGAKRERAKDYILSGRERVELRETLEAEGWEYVSTYKDGKYIKLQKEKSIGEKFENKVWLMFHAMGYPRMNRDSSLVISYDKSNPNLTKQVDVFAADDETVLVVECKAAEKPDTPGDFKTQIESFQYVRGGIIQAIKQEYGSTIEPKFIWATSNYTLGKDIERLKAADIAHFDDEVIEYYIGLARHLGVSAKYQLLGNLFASKDIKNMPTTVPAIKGKMGGHTYYSFSIEPERLLKIGYVLHRSDANRGMMPTYQRIVKASRLKSIQEFVETGGYFPNSVIISIDAPKKKGLKFDIKSGDTDSDTKLGILHLPKKYCSAYIIDGQHRLYGYSGSDYAKTNTIPVVAFENLDKKEQIRLFMEINENQKAVPKNLRNTLNADMLWESDDYNERRKALRLKIAQNLGESHASPLYDRILVGENNTTDTRCITMEAIDKGLREGSFFSKFDKNNNPITPGTFDNSAADNEYAYNLLWPFLVKSLKYFKDELGDEWALGKEGQGILTINTGVYALLRVMSDIIDHLLKQGLASPKIDNMDSLLIKCESFYTAIVKFYRELGEGLRREIKKKYGDSGSTDHWHYLQKAIHDIYPDFNPDGLEHWWANNSKEYNEIAGSLLALISLRVRADIEETMQSMHGQDWRNTGLPSSLVIKRAPLVAKKNIENAQIGAPKVDTWDCITLEDYDEIITSGSNWADGFKIIFTRPDSVGKRGTKKDSIKWINDMSKYDRKLSKLGTSITRSEYEYILSIAQWLCPEELNNIQLDEGQSE